MLCVRLIVYAGLTCWSVTSSCEGGGGLAATEAHVILVVVAAAVVVEVEDVLGTVCKEAILLSILWVASYVCSA
jgi:hypothetical protein